MVVRPLRKQLDDFACLEQAFDPHVQKLGYADPRRARFQIGVRIVDDQPPFDRQIRQALVASNEVPRGRLARRRISEQQAFAGAFDQSLRPTRMPARDRSASQRGRI